MQQSLRAVLVLSILAPVAAQDPPAPAAFEMRIVASRDYWAPGVAFDLVREAGRLNRWLSEDGNRARVIADPRAIERFNALTTGQGGVLNAKLRWYPRVIVPRGGDVTGFEPAYAFMGQLAVVPLFTKEEYEAGPDAEHQRLVELFPINMNEPAFTAHDLDPDKLAVVDEAGGVGLRYELREDRKADFREWTARNKGRSCAIIIDGLVHSAPVLKSAVAGAGVITGSWDRKRAEALVASIRAAALLPPPSQETLVDVGAGGGPLPSSADPEDIRAMQGAQQMLAAEKRLRKLIKEGKVKGVDRILTFEEISSWPYEDGLVGMPERVKKLDGKRVLMVGFMLPIDEVENIKEFLLVQSLWACCFGQPPDINGLVRVVMKGKARIDYQFDPIKVVGTFRVKATQEDGYCVDIFQLEADSVSVLK